MPTKPKSANGTSKLTVAEKASWYDENFASIQNFELAKSAAKQVVVSLLSFADICEVGKFLC